MNVVHFGGEDITPKDTTCDATAGVESDYTMPPELRRPWRTLTKLRELCGLSVAELAARSRLRPEDIVALESGVIPARDQVEALASVLGVSSASLVRELGG